MGFFNIKGCILWDFSKLISEEVNLLSEIQSVALLFTLLPPLRTFNSNLSSLLQPKLPLSHLISSVCSQA